jgi:NADH:ubiquinone reductase (H+-translocating)
MGRYVGRLIARRAALASEVSGQRADITGAGRPAPFRYHHLGELATIGRHAAVVKLGKLELTGFLGWLFWSVVHIYFLIGVRDRFIVAFTWFWDYLTFQRGARLITQVPPAERKQ